MRLRMAWTKALVGFCATFMAMTLFGVLAPIANASPIAQTPPFSGTIDVAGSASFSTVLTASGDANPPVTFSISPPVAGWSIVGAATLTYSGAPLAANTTYTIQGSDTDSASGSDSWSYALTVNNNIVQGSNTSGSTDVVSSPTFTTILNTAPGYQSGVTFQVTTPATGWTVNSGDVLTYTGSTPLVAGGYTISGSDTDTSGDSGSWSYALTVMPDTIVQGSPASDSISSNNSSTFTNTLSAASGFYGPVTFVTSTADFAINNGDQLATTAPLAASATPYQVSGTDSDAYGDSGTWAFALTVEPNNTAVSIIQTSTSTGTTTSASSATFAPGSILVENNDGPVTFVTTVSSPALSVSSAGVISTTGILTAGSYTVSGTDSDSHSDSGTWTYTLTVTAVTETVTFDANAGSGSMTPESAAIPTALSLNTFIRPGYTFVDWNTVADGSGTSYANGAVYPFTSSTTLYAQWELGKAVIHTVIFNRNGGSGSMAGEHENTPTALSANAFTRSGYTFVDWNTAANGSGTSYANHATYSFKSSVVLFAQWKKIPKSATFTVTFNAHGGKGTMLDERGAVPAALSANAFTRSGYTFVDWNTAANGSGTSYANHATYSFKSSVVLFAQWKVHHVVTPPAIDATALIGPFSPKSTTLTSRIEVQIGNLASEMKANHDTKVTLVGYGDKLTAANELNEAIWAANYDLSEHRASAVDTYLVRRLSALGISGFAISAGGDGSSAPSSGGSSASKQSNSGFVIAKLS